MKVLLLVRESDVVAIVDVPDKVTVAALSLAIAASGRLTLKTTPLLDPAEIDQATKKTVKYSPPGTKTEIVAGRCQI